MPIPHHWARNPNYNPTAAGFMGGNANRYMTNNGFGMAMNPFGSIRSIMTGRNSPWAQSPWAQKLFQQPQQAQPLLGSNQPGNRFGWR